MRRPDTASLATVSQPFIEDWLSALRRCSAEAEMAGFLERSGLGAIHDQPGARVTLDQIVRLYKIATVETGDEMTGLWSRPIRHRTLQHLLATVRESGSLPSALHRFSTFWNLLLDDFQFELRTGAAQIDLMLLPQGDDQVQRFGHMLILKLAHGLLSWLAGHEVPVRAVHFAFDRPSFAQDYSVIFPAPVHFDASASGLSFDLAQLSSPQTRSSAEMDAFLARAPRDWIFTSYHEHSQSLRVRAFLFRSDWVGCSLSETAQALGMSRRTLTRRMEEDGTSFQAIKDALRRDIAIRDLREGRKSIEEISQDVGFSSAANFHRAFRRWTGSTPRSYRSGAERASTV